MKTSLLSHTFLSRSLFLISQGTPRGRCLGSRRSITPSFHTVFYSHMLSLPSLSMWVPIRLTHTNTVTLTPSLSPSLAALLIYGDRVVLSVLMLSSCGSSSPLVRQLPFLSG